MKYLTMKTSLILSLLLTSHFSRLTHSQGIITPGQPQSNTFNASFPSPSWSSIEARVHAASSFLDNATRAGVLAALGYERSNWAAGESTRSSDFYTSLPANVSSSGAGPSPGALLKVEAVTNTSLYMLPPNVALSRILFQTANLNGTGVPASAYILWPWAPRRFGNNESDDDDEQGEEKGPARGKLPIVVWGHGTSGWSAECGPSHIRNLWYQYSAPYILALQGYVVVAPDYAGLGVGSTTTTTTTTSDTNQTTTTTTNKTTIRHQYLSTAAGDDLLYAVQAARTAFPASLGDSRFVVMGHSQGGGAAWAAAQRQASRTGPLAAASGPLRIADDDDDDDYYLGTVAASPSTTPFLEAAATALWPLIAQGLDSIWPGGEFDAREWLSPGGFARLSLLQDLQGCQSVKEELSVPGRNFGSAADWVNPAFVDSFYWRAYLDKYSAVGNLPVASSSSSSSAPPMLVIQGTGDTSVPAVYTDAAVEGTCARYPDSNIHYARFEGAEHVPVLYASQQVWLSFIEDLFTNAMTTTTTTTTTKREKKKKRRDSYITTTGCVTTNHTPYLDVARYQTQLAYFMEFPLYAYEIA